MQRTMKRIGALAIVFAMLVTFMSMLGAENVNAEEEEKTIDVYMMVSNAGVIAEAKDDSAMAWKKVTVEDLNEDEKYSFDEALVAAHKKYNEEDGYEVSHGTVKKLWGVETYNTLFFINGVGLTTGVTVDEVQNGDHLTAAVLADETYYSDWVSNFDKTAVTTKKDTDVELTLSGHLGMAWKEDDKKNVPLKGVQIGVWKDGNVEAIEEAVTDEDGKITLSFDDPGEYIITAKDGAAKDAVVSAFSLIGGKLNEKYYCADVNTYGIFYTEEDHGDGPYPVDELKTVDFMEWVEMDESEQEEYNLVYANEYDLEQSTAYYPAQLDAPLIAPCCVVKVPADPITASLTISDKGVFAQDKQGNPMINQDVDVTDYDASGEITYDEVLYAAHDQYFEDGTDGFALSVGEYGPYVTKFWGTETSNTSFYLDDKIFNTGVTETPVEDGQMLYASINQDSENYSDVFCGFDSYYKTVDPEEDVELTLSSIHSWATVPKELAGIQIGAWVGGEFKPIKDAVTDKDGKVTLNFDEGGQYIITAQGTVKGTPYGSAEEIDCPLMAPVCIVTVVPKPITVDVTVNNKGVIAKSKDDEPMVHQDVEVSDLNKDGKITVDEALQCAHAEYCKEGAAGYATETDKYGPMVTKLWGVESKNNLFFVNEEGLAANVVVSLIEDGDILYASINQDSENYSDVFCGFDSYYRSVDPGEDVKLKLSSIYSMATVPEDLADIQIGAWVGGEFKPIEGAVTNEDGEVTLNFDESGRYIITAQGTVRGTVTYPETKEVDCPLMAPVCIVAVVPDPITVDITVNDKGELAKSKDNEAMVRKAVVVPDLNRDGEITYDEALQCAHAEYCKDGADGYATEPSKYGLKVTKLWGYKTEDTLFFIDGKGLTASVAESPLENWDDLYASVNKDDIYYADYYTELANRDQSGCRAEKFELTLTGRQGMMGTEMKPLAGIQLGIWNNVDGFTPIEGAVTDENGEATFTIPEVGDYIITAKGTVRDVVTDWETGETKEYDCPIMAPFAFVSVYKNEDEEEACPVRQAIEKLPDDDKITLDDKDAVKALMAAYDNLSANAKDYVSELDLSKLKLSNAIVDKLQLEKDKQATDEELKAAKDKIAVLTVQAKLVKGVKAKGQKKKAKITWKSLGSGYTYEVYRATKLNGKFKKVKTTTSKKAVIKKLKSKKTYYVKVRAFKKVNGKKVYTNFSDTKSVKVK